MNAIAAVTENWGIGREGKLLMSLPEDMKFFREKTAGAVVIMGRATLESLPGKKPLKGRVNIVLSSDPAYRVEGATVVHDLREALAALGGYEEDRVFVIGGERVYRLLLPYCRRAFITKMAVCPEADKFFPDLDADADWAVAAASGVCTSGGVAYRFVEYENRHVKRAPEA